MELTKLISYEIIEQKELKDLKSEGALLRHKKSGARVVLISNDDDNKVFDIAFRTPTANNTGVQHIIEHTVLCGSEKFPAKDTFIEAVKGSLNTFLNAMTAPDRTMYPVASCNEKDFQNLMDIYLDAVFHPNIYRHEEIFRQEGWNYQLEEPDGELCYNGVVYNEMKGAYSSPETVMTGAIQKSLFPDTCYAYESGGNPKEIPSLTYEEYLNYHRTYYHPSNSYIYLYGDMDMAEKLAWLDKEYLSCYDEQKVNSEIHLQTPFDAMRDITAEYAVAANEPAENNALLSYNKVVGTTLDEKLYLAFQVLDYALLSAPGAPITMSLLESGIAQDVTGSYNTSFYQPVFSVTARGADENRKDEFVGMIEGILQAIVEQGMDPQALLAGINYYEFRFREADFGGYPKGLIYGMQMMENWLYDETKPFIHLEALDTFEFLKEQVETGYFEKLIQTYLLDNKHGSVITIIPEPGRTVRQDEELRTQLADYKASLSKEKVEKLVEATHRLAAYQEEPSTQEDLEKIPMLTREDISKEITPIYNEEMELAGVPTVFHEVETNGIGYLTLMFDMSDVPEELLPYAGVLNAVLGMVDTENYNYGTLFNEINVNTGGIEPSLEAYADAARAEDKAFRVMFEVHGKALYNKVPFLIRMMQEMLICSKLDDENRLREILAMSMSRLQMEIMSAGHLAAVLRAMSYSSPIAKCKDLMGGIGFFDNVCRLTMCFDQEKSDLIQKLTELTKILFRKGNMMISYTAARAGLEGLEAAVKELSESLYPERETQAHGVIACEKRNEGFKSSSQVQFVAQTGNFVDAGVEYSGALQILKTIMSFDYLWFNIRMRGGAYGCMSSFNRVGEGYFVSYRDPNLTDTLAVYEGIPEYLKNFTVSERDMTKFIIGTISGIDQPLTPEASGERSMTLYMTHVTAEMLQKERREILTAEEADIRALAGAAEAILKDKNICVIGNEAVVEEDRDVFMTVEELF